jgi:hypothetical protein
VRRVPGLAHRPGTYSGVEFKVPLFQTRAVGKLFVVPGLLLPVSDYQGL